MVEDGKAWLEDLASLAVLGTFSSLKEICLFTLNLLQMESEAAVAVDKSFGVIAEEPENCLVVAVVEVLAAAEEVVVVVTREETSLVVEEMTDGLECL